MKESLKKAWEILDLISTGISHNGTTANNTQKFTIEVSKNTAMIVAPEGLVSAIGNIRDELGDELQQPTKIDPPCERFDPAARLYQQMLALDPAKAASVSKIKTNGSSTEVTFATNPVLGRVNFAQDIIPDISPKIFHTEVTCNARTAEREGDGAISTT